MVEPSFYRCLIQIQEGWEAGVVVLYQFSLCHLVQDSKREEAGEVAKHCCCCCCFCSIIEMEALEVGWSLSFSLEDQEFASSLGVARVHLIW